MPLWPLHIIHSLVFVPHRACWSQFPSCAQSEAQPYILQDNIWLKAWLLVVGMIAVTNTWGMWVCWRRFQQSCLSYLDKCSSLSLWQGNYIPESTTTTTYIHIGVCVRWNWGPHTHRGLRGCDCTRFRHWRLVKKKCSDPSWDLFAGYRLSVVWLVRK